MAMRCKINSEGIAGPGNRLPQFNPMAHTSPRDKGLREVRADGTAGPDEGLDGQVFRAIEEFGDPGGNHVHARGQIGPADAVPFHKLQELLDNDQLAVFDFLVERGCLRKGFGQGRGLGGGGDFHALNSMNSKWVLSATLAVSYWFFSFLARAIQARKELEGFSGFLARREQV